MKLPLTAIHLSMVLVVAVRNLAADTTATQYHLTNLGSLGGTQSGTDDISINGGTAEIVGFSNTPSNAAGQPVLYGNGLVTDLGTLGGNNGFASAINSAGQIVGNADIASGAQHAFLYSGGVMQDINPFGGSFSAATDINSSGQIIGNSAVPGVPGATTHVFLYSGGVATDLTTLTGGALAFAKAMNDSGQIAGKNSQGHAALYSGGTVKDLGTLPGGANSFAQAVNAAGQVVGSSNYSTLPGQGQPHAFLYNGTTMSDLGTLGGNFSTATDINSSGQVVGYATTTGDADSHGFLYTGGTLNDLNSLLDSSGSGWDLEQAIAIADNGWIVGDAEMNDVEYAVLLTPVPEASAAILAMLSAAFLFAVPPRQPALVTVD